MDHKIAPNIYRTASGGWRVYVRTPHPETGRSRLMPKRFRDDGRPEAAQLEDLKHFRDRAKLEAQGLRRQQRRQDGPLVAAGQPTVAAEIQRYLALKTTKAMPSYDTRVWELSLWAEACGDRVRQALTQPEMDEYLQGFRTAGYAGSTVNKFRCALMALFTKLDGVGAANPVKATMLFQERDIEAQGLPFALWTPILKVVTSAKSRARLEVLLWTGIEPRQLARMRPHHIDLREASYTNPLRSKGTRTVRTPRAIIPKHMIYAETRRAFRHFVEANAFGPFSAHSLRMVLIRAAARVERERQKTDPAFVMPHVTLKLLRHSLATKTSEDTRGNLELVGQLLDHARGSKQTLRYALGAARKVMQQHARAIASRKRTAARRQKGAA